MLGVSCSGSWGMLVSKHQASGSQLGSNLPLGGANGELLIDKMQPIPCGNHCLQRKVLISFLTLSLDIDISLN